MKRFVLFLCTLAIVALAEGGCTATIHASNRHPSHIVVGIHTPSHGYPHGRYRVYSHGHSRVRKHYGRYYNDHGVRNHRPYRGSYAATRPRRPEPPRRH